MEIMQALKADGLSELDHAAIVRFYEKMAHVELRRQAWASSHRDPRLN
jgi:2-hydroxy-3-oxopropionate reductase